MRIIEAGEVEHIRHGEIPRHVGCIMDGNGRWAQMRGLPRRDGHAAAETAVFDVVDGCLDIGVPWLSAYAFSTENWARPSDEVGFLMSLNQWLLRKERRDELDEKGVQVRFLGRLDDERIPGECRDWLLDTAEQTKGNTRLVLAIAFNYGGRAEIVDAVNRLVAQDPDEPVTEERLHAAMYAGDMPDLDLVVRTSAEQRLSNYLLWHSAYAEFVFTDTLWPDFRRWHLYSAVAEYQRRRRRRGAASS